MTPDPAGGSPAPAVHPRFVDHGGLTLRQGDSLERLELDHEVRGDTLHVSLRHVREFGPPQLWLPWSGERGPELDLVLPAALEGEVALDVSTDAGDVDMIGFSTDGELTAQCGVGNVTLDLESLPTIVEVETETGEVTVDLPEGRHAVSADTSIGDLDVGVPNHPSTDRRYEFTTSIGDISIMN